MKPEKVNIILPEGYAGEPVELVFREGEAQPIRDDHNNLSIAVAMGSLFDFVQGRIFADSPKQNNGVLTYNYDEREVVFFANPNNRRADVLSASLRLHPDLVAFGINEEKQFTSKQLVKHITRFSHCFGGNIDAPKKLVKSLQNHEVKFEQQLKNQDDRQGNTDKSVKTALRFVEGELDPNWTLVLPLFKGEAAVELNIELQIDPVNGAPVYSFWCMELESIVRSFAIQTIDEVVDQFSKQFVTLQRV